MSAAPGRIRGVSGSVHEATSHGTVHISFEGNSPLIMLRFPRRHYRRASCRFLTYSIYIQTTLQTLLNYIPYVSVVFAEYIREFACTLSKETRQIKTEFNMVCKSRSRHLALPASVWAGPRDVAERRAVVGRRGGRVMYAWLMK